VLEPESVTGNALTGRIPAGLDQWLVEFITNAERETAFLRENGAESQAKARETLILSLLSRASEHLDAEIGVDEAAELLGRDPETVRRAIRDGRLPDLRENPRGHHRTRRGNVIALNDRRKPTYNSAADAQDIAKRRKGAA
jgi:hypothetical protein